MEVGNLQISHHSHIFPHDIRDIKYPNSIVGLAFLLATLADCKSHRKSMHIGLSSGILLHAFKDIL